ncbi:MAG: response regulator [Myxococcota bacterium]
MTQDVQILIADDSPGDVQLTIEALKDWTIGYEVNVVRNGEEVVKYLIKQDNYADAKTPDLILLDLNMPKMDGRQVLEKIKNDENLKRIPVIILTTSKSQDDIIKTYNLHANSYITKPAELDQFIQKIKSLEEYWFSTVRLPL